MNEMSNELISIIIVTVGENNYLETCLKSIKTQTHSKCEIIVIDNSFNQGLKQRVCKDFPDIEFYSSPKNLFYCSALNKGIKMSKGEFILCLNDDVVLDKKFIEEALRGFFIDTKVGMVSGKILRSDGETIDSTGLFLSFFRTAKERGYQDKDNGQFEKQEYIFGVNGAVAFYCKKMLEDIREDYDYFDSDFHFFYEDLDVAWRAKRRGWKGYYVPKAIAYHIRGGTARFSSGIDKPYARKYLNNELHIDLIKNRYITIIKNESILGLLLHLLAIILYDFIMWSYIILFRPQLIKSFLLNLGYLKDALKKRKTY